MSALKPLLIVPPAPARWHSLERLLADEAAPWLADLRLRLCEGVEGARDAIVVVPDGARTLACGCIRRRGDVGVLGHVYTAPEFRLRGLARRILQTLLSWFDMTGGRWLYLRAPSELHARLFDHFGFRVLHRAPPGSDALMLERTPAGVTGSPIPPSAAELHPRPLARADWPLIVALAQHRRGPDPRVPAAVSALAAESASLELIEQAERGTCFLSGACDGERIAALTSLAIDQLGTRTYAMEQPFGGATPALRAAVEEAARARGYEQIEYPMERIAEATTGS